MTGHNPEVYAARADREDEIRDLLRTLRLDAELSQPELAKRLGKTCRYVRRIESGGVDLKVRHVAEWCHACQDDFQLWVMPQVRYEP